MLRIHHEHLVSECVAEGLSLLYQLTPEGDDKDQKSRLSGSREAEAAAERTRFRQLAGDAGPSPDSSMKLSRSGPRFGVVSGSSLDQAAPGNLKKCLRP